MTGLKVTDDRAFARRLIDARMATGKSLRQGARDTGWSVSRITSDEAGHSSPSVRALRDLARLYATNLVRLLEGSPTHSDLIDGQPGLAPADGQGERRWMRRKEATQVLVDVGLVATPGFHVVGVGGGAVELGWVKACGRGLRLQRHLGGRLVVVRRGDVIGCARGT